MSRGRPSKDPILPSEVDTSNKKKAIKGEIYPVEWEVLKEKLENRGYTSIASWLEDQAKKVIKGEDLEELRKRKIRKIKANNEENEKLEAELKGLEDKLEEREEKIEDKIEEIKEVLAKKATIMDKRLKREYVVEDVIPDETGIKISDISKAKEILKKNYNEYVAQGKYKKEDFAEQSLKDLKEEDILEGPHDS